MTLDIKMEVGKLQKLYDEDPKQSTFSALYIATFGAGKTYGLRTARMPVHIDSFDPGGTKCLKKLILKKDNPEGTIVADTRWEKDDPLDPYVYAEWRKEFQYRYKNGYFDPFGTYALDSSTTWSQTIMNWVLKKAKIPGQAPRRNYDYVPQKMEIQNCVKMMLNLPCDFIMTGHLAEVKNAEGGFIRYKFMTTGQGEVTIPLMFDEIYTMILSETSSGVKYELLTKPIDHFISRSRLAQDGLLDTYEEPDIKKILKKAGYSCENKPIFWRSKI